VHKADMLALAADILEAKAKAKASPAVFWFVEAPIVDGKRLWMCARPKQMEFHKSDAWSRWLFSGNRWGKSTVVAFDLGAYLLGVHPYQDTPDHELAIRWYATTYGKVDEILIPKLRQAIGPQYWLGYNSTTHIARIQDPRGTGYVHRVYLCTYDQALMLTESGEYDRVAYDEPPPPDIYEANQVRLIDRGGHEVGAMTAKAKGINWDISWIKRDIIEQGHKHGIKWWRGSTEENRENLDPEAYERMLSKMTEAEKRIRIYGEFELLQGTIYNDPAFDELAHVCEPFDVRARLAKGLGSVWRGLDHGIGNPTAVSWWYVEGPEGDTKCYKFMEYLQDDLNIGSNVRNILRMDDGLPKGVFFADPSIWARDAVTGEELANEYLNHGMDVTPANNDQDHGHNKVQELMHIPKNAAGQTWREDPSVGTPRFMVFSHCHRTIEAYPRYVWARTKSARSGDTVAKPRPEEKFKHIPDTDRYVMTMHPCGEHVTKMPARPDVDKVTGRPRRIKVGGPVGTPKTFAEREVSALGTVKEGALCG